ncbi:hypothetical protein BH23GEM9_BH23GEM9_04170 [soil metagenome]
MKTFIIATLAATVLAACGGTTAMEHSDYEPLPADQVLIGVEHAMTANGVRQSVLKSDTTLIYDDSASIKLRVVNLTMYNEDGTVRATLTSESGELDQTSNKMVARGSVELVVLGAQGRTVWTEELHYDPTQRRVWSTVHTRTVTARGERLEGDGFTADDQFRNIEVMRPRGTGLRIEF